MCDETQTKVCKICALDKPITEFYKKHKGKYGVTAICKSCSKALGKIRRQKPDQKEKDRVYRLKHRDRQKAYMDIWYTENREERNIKAKMYRKSRTPEQRLADKEYQKKYHEENRQHINAVAREYVERNKEKVKAYKLWHQREYAHIYRARAIKRDLQRDKATPDWADFDRMKEIYNECFALRAIGLDYEVDHIVPLQSDFVCGLHCEYNLQILPAEENIAKRNYWWEDMPNYTKQDKQELRKIKKEMGL